MKNSLRTVVFTVGLLILCGPLWAHVVVNPSEAGVGTWVTFTVSVPNEKNLTNIQLKLVIPPGLEFVTPTLKQGWAVTVERGPNGEVAALVWAGSLPPEFRDDFSFSAHLPAKPVDLPWKAYQTYQDGEVVGWDMDPSAPSAKDPEALETTGKGPFSVTHVFDDLGVAPAADSPSANLALLVSIVALVLGFVALVRGRKAN